MKNNWYKEAVFYQIYPRSFCDANNDGIGDIRGIISKLDYLKELGINAIWFSPLYCSPNADYGYDISDYCNINPEYGTMEDFDEMLKGLHDRGIKVVMDLVINHTSDKHKWFLESRKSKDNPYRDYYYWRDGKGKDGKKPPNNWSSFFVGSAWKYDETTNQWYMHLFDQNQPDLNYSNPKVIEEVKNVLRFWLDKGVDGFRCDVINLLSKTPSLPNGTPSIVLCGREHYIDGDKMPEILAELQNDVLKKYDAFTVGESVMITVDRALRYISEENPLLETVFSFEHMSADNFYGVKQLVRRFSLKRLKKALRTWQHGLYGKAWNTNYFENHDQPRIVGRYCSDSVLRVEGAKMIANTEMCLTGTPFIYEGQEIGTTSIRMSELSQYQDVESKRSYKLLKMLFGKKGAMKRIAYASRDNARTPVQWNTQKNAGFSQADETWLPVNPNYTEINVESCLKDENSILHHYKKLIALRKQYSAMIYGSYTDFYQHSNKLLVYLKEHEGQKVLCVNNYSLKPCKFAVPQELLDVEYELVLSNYADSQNVLKDCTLQPYESAIYVAKKS